MNWLKTKSGLVSLAFMLPALFLTSTGIFYAAFGVEAANHLPDALMAYAPFRLILSPAVVLGGPLVVFAMNAGQVFHLSADTVNEEFVVALSVKRLFSHLLWLALAGGLLLVLATYALVENFKIVPR